MSFTSIQTVAQPDGFTVTWELASGDQFATVISSDPDGVLPIAEGGFGIDSAGRPYFDSGGADPGELAILGFDVQVGLLYLEGAGQPDVSGRLGAVARLRRLAAMARPPRRALPPRLHDPYTPAARRMEASA